VLFFCFVPDTTRDKYSFCYKDEKIWFVQYLHFTGGDSLQQSQVDEVVNFLKSNLAGKVFEVRTTQRLDSHPCVVIVPEMAAARHFIRTQAQNLSEENRFALLRPQLEINAK
jgi:HSP90 family molecular chaperone